MALELRDARRSGADREWLTNVYPFYLHDLSEFDLAYYTLDDRGVWMPDHRAGWLVSFWRRVIGEYGGGRHPEWTDETGVWQVIDTTR